MFYEFIIFQIVIHVFFIFIRNKAFGFLASFLQIYTKFTRKAS